MGCQGIPLATRGMIICPQRDITRIIKCIIPFNVRLKADSFLLNLQLNSNKNINLKIQENKLNIKRLSSLKLSKRLSNPFKLNLKKCED